MRSLVTLTKVSARPAVMAQLRLGNAIVIDGAFGGRRVPEKEGPDLTVSPSSLIYGANDNILTWIQDIR
jgi:hypothetical protein